MNTIASTLVHLGRPFLFPVAVVAASGLGFLVSWAAGSWLLAALTVASVGIAVAVRWALWKWRRPQEEQDAEESAEAAVEQPAEEPKRRRRRASTDDSEDLIETMLSEGRYALLLRPQIVGNLNEKQVHRALGDLEDAMALTPEGTVLLRTWRAIAEHDGDPSDDHIMRVEAFYLDRYPVTNAEYLRFVEAGGYEQMSLWDPDVWSGILDFVDRTGEPGPAEWEDGCYPRGQDDYPVVGVSWFEAAAYARWVGKRLPTDAEWVKASSWPVGGGGGRPVQRKYPWGDSMDHSFANLWHSQIGEIVPVTKFEEGVSVGGVYQLIGNVWEWTHSNFGAWDEAARRLEIQGAMKSLRGGAFDTYFDNQATCQFQSGDSSIARKHNIGFRCCLGLCDLAPNLAEDDAAPEAEPLDVDQQTGELEAAI